MNKPNFIIAGAARSGTTALAYALAQHPDVFLTSPKEMHFLAYANENPVFTGPGDEETVTRTLVTDPVEYSALFKGSEGHAARGEGSVSSLYLPEKALDSIAKYADPAVKVIVMLREPAKRSHSSYLYLRARGFEHLESFEEALAAEDERVASGYHHMWHLRGMSRYAKQLPVFAEALGDNLLVLVQEEYVSDQNAELSRVCSFLGIDPGFRFDAEREVNRGGEPKSLLLNRVSGALRANPVTQTLVRAVVPKQTRERIRLANLERPEAPVDMLAALQTEFEPDRRCVEQVLGRQISAWGTM